MTERSCHFLDKWLLFNLVFILVNQAMLLSNHCNPAALFLNLSNIFLKLSKLVSIIIFHSSEYLD